MTAARHHHYDASRAGRPQRPRAIGAGILVASWLGFAGMLEVASAVEIQTPADSSVTYRDRIAVITRGLPGAPVTLEVNGDAVQTQIMRTDAKADFLNVAVPAGPVLLRVRQRLPGGVTAADSARIHVVGAAAEVLVELEPAMLPADSLSRSRVDVRVVDRWGMPLPEGQLISVHLDRGLVLAHDLYPDEPGVQVQVRDGSASFAVLAASSLGEGLLRVSADGVQASAPIGYTQPVEEWTVVGLATAQLGWRAHESPPAGIAPPSSFKGGSYLDGRTAVYASGTVADDYLLVTSYDSERDYDDRVFRYLTPERVYPIYGDASSVFYEAPSASPLYAKLARGRDYLMYGDFATRLGADSEVAAYNRSFTGVSSRHETGEGLRVELFGASTDQSIQVDEARGEGVSGYYYLSAASQGVPIVEGSERVVLQVRDRLHPEQVLKEDVRHRFTDYEIDYEAGTLLFKQPVPASSPEEHPIYIVTTYETARSIEQRWTGGGHVETPWGDAWQVGATAVGEERARETYWLTAIDGRFRPRDDVTARMELARSSAAGDGWAWKGALRGRLAGGDVRYDVQVREAGREFDNPSSPTVRPGVRKIRGRTAWSPGAGMEMTAESHAVRDRINDEERTSVAVDSRWRWRAFDNRLGVDRTHTDRRGRSLRSRTVSAATQWAATPRWRVGAQRDQTFGDEDLSYRPTLTRLRSRWKLNERSDLVVEHAFRDGSLIDSSFTAVALQSQFADEATAYANYQIDGGIAGRQNQAIVGLRHDYRPRRDLTLHTAFERTWTLREDGAASFYAYSLAAEYLPRNQIKTSGRFEQRRGRNLDKTVVTTALDLALGRDLFALAKQVYAEEGRAQGTAPATSGKAGVRAYRIASGLAYRPSRQDRVNGLARHERRFERNTLVTPARSRRTDIGSFELILEPRLQLEWFARYAFKVADLDSRGLWTRTLTDLWMTNVRLEWGQDRWDVLGEYRLLTQHYAGDRSHGAAAECGWIAAGNVRVAGGYNFSGHHDGDLAGLAYWARGPYIKLQSKFSEAAVASWLDGMQNAWDSW